MTWIRLAAIIGIMTCYSSGSAASAAPVVVFDQGHKQQFLVEKDGKLDLSRLAGICREKGLAVRSATGTLNIATLRDVDALVISGPFAPLGLEENAAILDFLVKGGRLAILLHIPFPVENLLKTLGVAFSNGVLQEKENLVDGKAQDFYVTQLEKHPLTSDVSRFATYGCWALVNTGTNAGILARTGQQAWVDLNKDGILNEGDAQQALGVLVFGKLGKGEFVVFGDDAIFQNRFLGADNRKLAENLALWLKGQPRPPVK